MAVISCLPKMANERGLSFLAQSKKTLTTLFLSDSSQKMNSTTLKARFRSFIMRDCVQRDFGEGECSFGRADERLNSKNVLAPWIVKWIGDVDLVCGEQE